MTMIKRVLFSSVTVASLGLACAVYFGSSARTMHRQAFAASQQQDVGTREIEALQSAIDAAKRNYDELESQCPSPNPRQAATTAGAKPGWSPADTQAALRRSPELQLRFAAAQRARLYGRYGPLFRRLCLSPAQIEKFAEAKAIWEERGADATAAFRAQNLDRNSPEGQQVFGPIWRDYVTAQTELLGPDGFKQLQEFERTSPARGTAAALAGAAAMRGAALTSEQAEQLARTLTICSSSYASGGNADPKTIDWDKAFDLAQAFLTPAQYALVTGVVGNGPEGLTGRSLSELHAAIERGVRMDQEKGQTE